MSEIRLELTLVDSEADDEMLDRFTYRMMQDLRDIGVESVERLHGGDPPEGAKGDPFTIGALTLVTVPPLLTALVTFLKEWAMRNQNQIVKIKTPGGFEVEFPTEYSEEKFLALVDKLSEREK